MDDQARSPGYRSCPISSATRNSANPNSPAGTPLSLRNRGVFASSARAGEENELPTNISPTASTFSASGSFADRLGASQPFGSMSLMGTPPVRKMTIRADPTLVTCFDPADKVLYDLWAPKA